MNEIVLDTNILIYSIDKDSLFFDESQKLLFDSNYKLFTTSKNISEFLAVVTRKSIGLSLDDALSVIEDFASIITIIYPSSKSFSFFTKLLNKYKPTGLKIHDFEIISIALEHNIKNITTANITDFKNVSEINLIKIS